ncbi:hypothetical protein J3F84DRAFT_364690 [Trichoderma pleuroticola]
MLHAHLIQQNPISFRNAISLTCDFPKMAMQIRGCIYSVLGHASLNMYSLIATLLLNLLSFISMRGDGFIQMRESIFTCFDNEEYSDVFFFINLSLSLFCPISSCLLALLDTHRLETAPQAHQAGCEWTWQSFF